MAEQENASPRFSFFPIILGMLEPNFDQESSERFVLLNPFTQSMVVLNGGAGILSAVLGGATTESVTGRPPASKASIKALKIIKKEETENEAAEAEAECVVCLEKLFEKEKEEVVVKEMPCGHRYHGECIEKWLHMHGSCPMCRYNMPKEEGEGKKREEERGEGTGNGTGDGTGTGDGVWVRISFERRDEGAGDQRRSESD